MNHPLADRGKSAFWLIPEGSFSTRVKGQGFNVAGWRKKFNLE